MPRWHHLSRYYQRRGLLIISSCRGLSAVLMRLRAHWAGRAFSNVAEAIGIMTNQPDDHPPNLTLVLIVLTGLAMGCIIAGGICLGLSIIMERIG